MKENKKTMQNMQENSKGQNAEISKNSEKTSKNQEKTPKNNENTYKNKDFPKKEKQSGEKKTRKVKKLQGAVIGLTVATSILAASTLGLGIGYGITQSQAINYGNQIEGMYRNNYYSLVDNVNTADMKVSKLLASSNDTYRAKMLGEVSDVSKDMQANIASLPLEGQNVQESVRFINQMGGYTSTLETKLAQGGTLSDADMSTLSSIHESLTEMKRYLNQMSQKMWEGYSILDASSTTDGDFDIFTNDFSQMKSSEADYPSMIYDGPFSDSVVNAQVKGLSGKTVSKDEAYSKVDSVFKNVSNIKYEGETDGKFSTYNFSMDSTDGENMYVQITKIGANVLTVSGNVDSDNKNIDKAQAEKIALNFAKENGIEQAQVVWNEELQSQAYFNIAPVENGVVLYPDLVKVKVDMEHGEVIGYDAISYFTNHTSRTLSKPAVSKESTRAKIDESFEIKNDRLVLAPLDFNREELCFEFECEREGSTYYIYYNAISGEEENILKVVKTTDGSKLM